MFETLRNAVALIEGDRAAEAVPLLEQLAGQQPFYVTVYVLLARAFEAQARWDEARSAWQQAYFLLPNSPVIHRRLQLLLQREAQWVGDGGTTPPPAVAPPVVPEASRPALPPVETPVMEAPPIRPVRLRSSGPPVEAAPPSPPEVTTPSASPTREEPPAGKEPPAHKEPPRKKPPPEPDPAPRVAEVPPPPDVPAQDAIPAFEDLDRLIEELEAARIVPRPDLEHIPAPDLEDEIEDVVSETLARIYAAQKQYDEAARVYELLAAQQPEKAKAFQEKAAELRARAADR